MGNHIGQAIPYYFERPRRAPASPRPEVWKADFVQAGRGHVYTIVSSQADNSSSTLDLTSASLRPVFAGT